MFDGHINIKFNKKPIPISADYRPIYKLAELTLILKLSCIKEKASLEKLHFISWVMGKNEYMKDIENQIAKTGSFTMYLWRVEPSVSRALDIGIAEGILEYCNERYQLTNKGELFVKDILSDNQLMSREKEFLNIIGKRKITEKIVKDVYKNLEVYDAKNTGFDD